MGSTQRGWGCDGTKKGEDPEELRSHAPWVSGVEGNGVGVGGGWLLLASQLCPPPRSRQVNRGLRKFFPFNSLPSLLLQQKGGLLVYQRVTQLQAPVATATMARDPAAWLSPKR